MEIHNLNEFYYVLSTNNKKILWFRVINKKEVNPFRRDLRLTTKGSTSYYQLIIFTLWDELYLI